MPGHPRKDAARRLDDLQHQAAARIGSPGPEEKYRGRTADLERLRGDERREKSIPKSGGGEKRIPEALDALIELYTATNKPDEVKKWQAERAKYPPAKAVK